MTVIKILLIILSLGCVSVVAETTASGSNRVVTPANPGTVIMDNQSTPVARPGDKDKRVAVLTIAWTFSEGRVRSAELVSSRVINAIAPKVFARQGGDWRVTLSGGEKRSFYVNNPGRREAEAPRGSKVPYEWVEYSGTLEWPLVLPMYDRKGAFEIDRVTITDVETGRVLFDTRL